MTNRIKLTGNKDVPYESRPDDGQELTYKGWTLRYTIGAIVCGPITVGDDVTLSDGTVYKVTGGNPPHKPSSTGKVWIKEGERTRELYPHVIGAKWVEN